MDSRAWSTAISKGEENDADDCGDESEGVHPTDELLPLTQSEPVVIFHFAPPSGDDFISFRLIGPGRDAMIFVHRYKSWFCFCSFNYTIYTD